MTKGAGYARELPAVAEKVASFVDFWLRCDAFSCIARWFYSRFREYLISSQVFGQSMRTVVGVLALQGAFVEHLALLRKAADFIGNWRKEGGIACSFDFTEVRTPQQLSLCDALVIPGGESTTISLVAADSGLLEPLRDFVKYDPCPVHLS